MGVSTGTGGGSINSIQRGVFEAITINAGANKDINITSVDMAKSTLNILLFGIEVPSDRDHFSVTLQSSTNIRVANKSASNLKTGMSWEVIEFL